MLNADLILKDEAASKGNSKKTQSEDNDNAAGFHFIAFMPIRDTLWKFDGLERQPMSLGRYRCLLLDFMCAKHLRHRACNK